MLTDQENRYTVQAKLFSGSADFDCSGICIASFPGQQAQDWNIMIELVEAQWGRLHKAHTGLNVSSTCVWLGQTTGQKCAANCCCLLDLEHGGLAYTENEKRTIGCYWFQEWKALVQRASQHQIKIFHICTNSPIALPHFVENSRITLKAVMELKNKRLLGKSQAAEVAHLAFHCKVDLCFLSYKALLPHLFDWNREKGEPREDQWCRLMISTSAGSDFEHQEG